MLIDFRQAQLDKFLQLATKIMENPQHYLQFDSVSDFYPLERKTSPFRARI